MFPRLQPALILLPAVLLAAPAHALERITLTTGFTYDCSRHEPADPTHVRLYFHPATPAAPESWQDIPATIIASIDFIPDPEPAPTPLPTPAPLPTPSPTEATIPDLLAASGTRHNIDTDLLAAVVHAESGGNTRAVSRAGARGLMQLMPGTARDLGVDDPFRPDQNIAGGAAYLDALLTRYHDDLTLTLAAYNAGPAAVDRYHGIPPYPETRAYVARVETEFKRRKQEQSQEILKQRQGVLNRRQDKLKSTQIASENASR